MGGWVPAKKPKRDLAVFRVTFTAALDASLTEEQVAEFVKEALIEGRPVTQVERLT
jgi:hypothetical protein